MKELKEDGEFTQGDVKRFLYNSHFAIITSIVVIGFATYINGPFFITIIFGLYAFYKLWILKIYQNTKEEALDSDMDIIEFMNNRRKNRES